jgi:hypothetical protein
MQVLLQTWLQIWLHVWLFVARAQGSPDRSSLRESLNSSLNQLFESTFGTIGKADAFRRVRTDRRIDMPAHVADKAMLGGNRADPTGLSTEPASDRRAGRCRMRA